MIKNVAQRVVPLLVLGGAAVGLWWLSREQKPDVFRHLQGVVEMDDTVLSFEVGGPHRRACGEQGRPREGRAKDRVA